MGEQRSYRETSQASAFMNGLCYQQRAQNVTEAIESLATAKRVQDWHWPWIERNLKGWWADAKEIGRLIPLVRSTFWRHRAMFVELVGHMGEDEINERFAAMLPPWPEDWEVPEDASA
jgi:hypothetical protein